MTGLDWRRIEGLRGQTLSTVTGRSRFEVRDVGADYVIVAPLAGSGPRPIPRSQFEEAFDLGRRGVELVPSALERHGIVTRNSSYIVALLRAADKVRA